MLGTSQGRMMTAILKPVFTPKEYLAFERNSPEKHEYYDGEVYAMAGASYEHGTIADNIVAHLRTPLRKTPYRAKTGGVRVRIHRTPMYVYPDVYVVGDPQFEDAENDILLNPLIVFEVLPRSTEKYDRNFKFDMYRKIPSLKEYVLVSQGDPCIVHYSKRAGKAWKETTVEGLGNELLLPSLGIALGMDAIYEEIDFDLGD